MHLAEIERIFAVVCLFASITLYFQSSSELYLKFFPFYILMGIIVEWVGYYFRLQNKNTTLMNNIYSVIEFVFYFFVLGSIIRNKKIKATIFYISIIYILFSGINFFFVLPIFNSLAYSMACLLLVGFCVYYFFELFQRPKATKLAREPSFWICTAIFFSYCCNFPVFAFLTFLLNPSAAIISSLTTILLITNIFTYSLYTIAFLCRIRINKSILSS
jgi:hypothetical protein